MLVYIILFISNLALVSLYFYLKFVLDSKNGTVRHFVVFLALLNGIFSTELNMNDGAGFFYLGVLSLMLVMVTFYLMSLRVISG